MTTLRTRPITTFLPHGLSQAPDLLRHFVRFRAAKAEDESLADIGAREALSSLLVAVEDDDPHVRQMALSSLGELGDPRATQRLERALRDARPEVRYQAVIAFSRVAKDDPASVASDVTEVVSIDLSRPMAEIRAELARYPVKTRLSLTGTMVVARDIAHAKIAERLDAGEPMPSYLRDHPVYYAGPAKTPAGYASGAFGPTTAGRMDSYVERFQAAGGSLVMLAKGNRSTAVTEACKRHGGFYLGSIGGAAARLAQDCITKVEVLEYPELGMEAVWKIEVRDFPAFIIVDDKGNDFFAEAAGPLLSIGSHP